MLSKYMKLVVTIDFVDPYIQSFDYSLAERWDAIHEFLMTLVLWLSILAMHVYSSDLFEIEDQLTSNPDPGWQSNTEQIFF